MQKKTIASLPTLLIIGIFLMLNSCSNTEKESNEKETQKVVYPSDIIPFFKDWNLILGDGSNVGHATDFEHEDFFYARNDDEGDWIVYKAPNSGDTHGTSNNTRTELAQSKKWSPMTEAKLTASLKVMNVSTTGDARVAASYSVVVGQIHSADGHENEPLKIFYKKFPGHTKGSVFWHYEINTAGDDNAKRWDYSTAVWGHDFSVVGTDENTYPEEPKEGIALGEEFSYEIEVKDGIMHLKFNSEGHETKTFTKNLIQSEYTTTADIPEQTRRLFVPIGQDGVERANAYADEGLFFKQGSYNQTNGKSPEVNKNWCSGAETHGGNIQKQYEDGNYAEVWFRTATIYISDDAVSNKDYFNKNDITLYPSDVIPFMEKFKILNGDGSSSDHLANYEKKEFFYVENEGGTNWVVYKTPNAGTTSKNSSNTRTELHQKEEWTPETGGKLSGTLKVMHVSTSGDARVAASYATVIGQIHSGDGHENEPCKIFYKKFPGHKKGSVFWNYEINTKGDNSKRWDYSTAVWGYDMSVVGESPTTYPEEPKDGIELGEEFSYEINVYKGIMYLSFTSEGHETVKFTKNLLKSDFARAEDLPEQTQKLFVPIGRDGLERENAYAGEMNYFKQGAYNQTNGKSPEDNIIWSTGADIYGGDIAKQYENGDYTEVWFKEATIGAGTPPK